MWRKTMFYRPTWAEIDLKALVENFRFAQKQVSPKTIIPVIKADAYGHGAKEVMTALIEEGVTFFAVSLLEEALELREVSSNVEILMLGPILPKQFELCHKHSIQFTIYDEHIAKSVFEYKKRLMFHMKVETGMHRYGLDDLEFVIKWMEDLQKTNHDLVGIYSHFATANEQNDLFFNQIKRMEEWIKELPYLPPMIHLSNSSASLRYEQNLPFTTHARLGISLYGLSLDQDQKGLSPVMKLKSKVVEIKTLKMGETVGYGGTYQATKDNERIAMLPIGYADGWIRGNKTGYVEINHALYKIVGIICMDACFVKVDQNVSVGDEVILFGGMITTDQVAKRLKTISYEVVCLVSKRVPRIIRKEE